MSLSGLFMKREPMATTTASKRSDMMTTVVRSLPVGLLRTVPAVGMLKVGAWTVVGVLISVMAGAVGWVVIGA
eukprot:jgi/Chrpa1/9026/Chrysochromulina_OHIO_Genome00017005-RA